MSPGAFSKEHARISAEYSQDCGVEYPVEKASYGPACTIVPATPLLAGCALGADFALAAAAATL